MSLNFFILIIVSSTYVFSSNMDALKIMEKVYNRHESKSQVSDMKMILQDQSSKKRIRKLKVFKQKNSNMTKSLLLFSYPKDVKNSGFLTYDYSGTETNDKQWLYLPALKRIKQITSNERSKSFMGSDFTYGDMKKPEINHFNYHIIKSTKINSKDVWIIEALPINNKIIKETGYTKSILFVRKDIYFIIRAVHFLKKQKQKYYDVKTLKKINNIWIATQSTMATRQKNRILHQTTIEHYNIKFNKNFDSSLLSLRGLKNGI